MAVRPPGEHEPSDERFLPLVERAALGTVVALLVLAAIVPAPLERPADAAHPPNPARSAWFLLWIQELVSWGTPAIWVAVGLAALLVALPWLPIRPVDHARWFPPEQRGVGAAVVAVAAVVLVLTIVASFLRGPDWALVWPS